MALIPSAFDEAHGLNPWLKRLAPWFVALMVPLLVFFQQFTVDLHSRRLAKPLPEVAKIEEPEDPGVGALAITSKALIKRKAYEAEKGRFLAEESLNSAMDFLDLLAKTRNDRVRVAIVAAELLGPSVAVNRLDTIMSEATPGGDLLREAGELKAWYAAMDAKRTHTIDPAIRDWIIARQGWFGQLALSYGKPLSDDMRWETASGFEAFAAFAAFMGLFQFLTLAAGIVFLVVGISMVASGRVTPADGETVAPAHIYWETFGVFCLLFLIMVAVGILTLGQRGGWVVFIDELAVWSAMLAIWWPRLRGVSMMELSDDMGFNKGAGWGKELAVGFGVFAAGFPVTALVGAIVSAMAGDQPEEPIGVAMFEPPLQGSWAPVILGAIGASIWAPVLEEIMFRGALMGALRKRMSPYAAAAVAALVFGAYHPYGVEGIASVAAGGFVYGMAKAWRGSLIAPIFAHFLWNTTIGVTELGRLFFMD
ncbi:MAG: CPBP family intramembrane glutamic endopeptidase [Phycisphaerales bacterium]